MVIDYIFSANDSLKDASEILIEITDIKIDDTVVDIGGTVYNHRWCRFTGIFQEVNQLQKEIF